MENLARSLIFPSPLTGILLPLSEVPDPVFSQKIFGDGVAILPVGQTLVAPCDATVTTLHASSHALTLTTREGIEVLLHIGIDSVSLEGQGFSPFVSVGDAVKKGDPLVTFDLALLERSAKSPISLMVLPHTESIEQCRALTGSVQAGVTPALEIVLKTKTPAETAPQGEEGVHSWRFQVRNAQGLHARPAAVLANAARRFACSIRLIGNGHDMNAKSVTDILSLNTKRNDTMTLSASGRDADDAIAVLVPLLESGLGENLEDSGPLPEESLPVQPHPPANGMYRGIAASPGLACGPVFQLRREIPEVPQEGLDPAQENAVFSLALSKAMDELEAMQRGLEGGIDDRAAIFWAQRELLQDPEILLPVRAGIAAGQSAAYAWKDIYTIKAAALSNAHSPLFAARAADIRDVGRRVLSLICRRNTLLPEIPANSIVITDELSPSETARLDTGLIAGICTASGSAASHASILARAKGIPAICGVDARALTIEDGVEAVLDGTGGTLRLVADAAERAKAHHARKRADEERERDRLEAMRPALTKDGRHIPVLGNIGGVAETNEIAYYGGEGVGLLRSEFLFLNRDQPPSEEEQAQTYRIMAETLGPDRILTVRTLDAGGDKQLPYLSLSPEDNPFLGLRGIRINRKDASLFRTQVRALLKTASTCQNLRILFPMIACAEELRQAKAILAEEKNALELPCPAIRVGIMVEVPSAALLAENLAAEADFLSIGTNDLTQFTLGADRNHAGLAHLSDALHPAVLRLIHETVRGARMSGKKVGVCGALAADLAAVPLLIGLGVDSLSLHPGGIPAVKKRIRSLEAGLCETIAADCLTMLTAEEVRRYAATFYS